MWHNYVLRNPVLTVYVCKKKKKGKEKRLWTWGVVHHVHIRAGKRLVQFETTVTEPLKLTTNRRLEAISVVFSCGGNFNYSHKNLLPIRPWRVRKLITRKIFYLYSVFDVNVHAISLVKKINILFYKILNNFYPVTSYRRVEKESDVLLYRIWSLVMVRESVANARG